MSSPQHPSRRSFTGHHTLLPASHEHTVELEVPIVPTRTFISWTFGRGTVIWRIWPAVLLHTAFAALIVSVSLKTKYNLSVPGILLTVLGVVIGFVISYRAMSGYDRYWMGRSSWSDVIRNVRTMSRLIWFHVPIAQAKDEAELTRLMAEKRLALDLLEAFVVALKHHLRGEMGIYYEDLYHLVQPLHDHPHAGQKHSHDGTSPTTTVRPGLPAPAANTSSRTSLSTITTSASASQPHSATHDNGSTYLDFPDPVVPPVTAYGTFTASTTSRSSSRGSSHGEARPLLPGNLKRTETIVGHISTELIPFESAFSAVGAFYRRYFSYGEEEGGVDRKWGSARQTRRLSHTKHRPRVAGGGQNLPLEILRALSEWLSVLEMRPGVPGNGLGGMYGVVQSFEDNLSTLERILTTPLPFVYSVHIRHTVWIYLFFLPFQLIDDFAWYTIPGVGIAAFIYLGFLAAGEEIEQPFGYDENDLDLDLFCREVVHVDIETLKRTPAHNVHLPAHHAHHRSSIVQAATVGERGSESVDEAFGVLLG